VEEFSNHHQTLGRDMRRPGESGWGKPTVASGRLCGWYKVIGTIISPKLSKPGWRSPARGAFTLRRWHATYLLRGLESSLGVSEDRTSCRSRKTSCGLSRVWL